MSYFRHPILWEKRGLLLTPETTFPWHQTHSMMPTPADLGGGVFKIYFSGRNQENQSHIGWVMVDCNPHEPLIIERGTLAVLTPGRLGCFDDNGVTPSCVITHTGTHYLFYVGWNPGSTVRVHLYGGLAQKSEAEYFFTRYSEAPILERTRTDPLMNTAPWIVRNGTKWYMYYVRCTGWVHKDWPRYHICLATSSDLVNWKRDGHVCIDYHDDCEHALARPYVLQDGDVWKMWFSRKSDSSEYYRMGYAESHDGVIWARNDTVSTLAPSPNMFDSEMVAYPIVLKVADRYIMLYNGNRYGEAGFGYAVGYST